MDRHKDEVDMKSSALGKTRGQIRDKLNKSMYESVR